MPCGVTIVESIAYIALVAFLLMCGVRFFNVVYHHNKAVAKATVYTTSVLDAAKHWRRDVANTKGEPQLVRGEQFDVIEMKQASGGIVRYRVNRNRLERHNGEEWVPIVGRVVSSIMLPDPREHVKAWCWELALETKSVYLVDRMRFSFVAVPGHPLAPRPEKVPRPEIPEKPNNEDSTPPTSWLHTDRSTAGHGSVGTGSIEPQRHPVSRSQ